MNQTPSRRPGIDGLSHRSHKVQPHQSHHSHSVSPVKPAHVVHQPRHALGMMTVLSQVFSPRVDAGLKKLAIVRLALDIKFWLLLCLPFIALWALNASQGSPWLVFSGLKEASLEWGYPRFVMVAAGGYVVIILSILATTLLNQVMLGRELLRSHGHVVGVHSLVRLTAANALKLTFGWFVHVAAIFLTTVAVTWGAWILVRGNVVGRYYLAAIILALGLSLVLGMEAVWYASRLVLATSNAKLRRAWLLAWRTVVSGPVFSLWAVVLAKSVQLIFIALIASSVYFSTQVLLGQNSAATRAAVWVLWLMFGLASGYALLIASTRYWAGWYSLLLLRLPGRFAEQHKVAAPSGAALKGSWKGLVLCLVVLCVLCAGLLLAVAWRDPIVTYLGAMRDSLPMNLETVVPGK